MEKEIAWQAYDAARKTREALVDARKRLKMDKVEDWSELTGAQLVEKLKERKVITLQSGDGKEDKDSVKCLDGLQSLCRQLCFLSQRHTPSKSSKKSDAL